MSKPRTSLKRGSASASINLLSAPPSEVEARVNGVMALLAQAEDMLGGLVELTLEERKFSSGRLRSGEPEAITSLLDAADQMPEHFIALAAKDYGSDDAVFESAPTRADLARRAHLSRLSGVLTRLSQGVSDTVLVLGEHVREVSVPAYAIARTAAPLDSRLRTSIAPAVKHFGAASAKARVARRNKKEQTPDG